MFRKFYMKFLEICKNAALGGAETPSKLALSFSMGLYVSFSPFPGLHTIMMLIFKWVFGLNFPIMFITASINNPWTMIPFYSLDYAFGHWFLHDFLGLSPGLVVSLGKYLGGKTICLWSFLIGGNILGVLSAVVSYPLCKRFFLRLTSGKNAI